MRIADISVVTPTCERPIGIALAERMMRQQTVQPREWIVADRGLRPAHLTQRQRHLRLQPAAPGAGNFLSNLAAAVQATSGSVVLFWEDDDYYAPTHLEVMERLCLVPAAVSVGDEVARYYHVGARRWKAIYGQTPALCQTAIRSSVVSRFLGVLKTCLAAHRFAIDVAWWESLRPTEKVIQHTRTVVGIKGLPGTPGLGIGHTMTGRDWRDDPTGAKLDAWLGQDAEWYRAFATPQHRGVRVE